jgi:hypothetical protein
MQNFPVAGSVHYTIYAAGYTDRALFIISVFFLYFGNGAGARLIGKNALL